MPSIEHGSVDAGPVDYKLGGKATTAAPTAVDIGDRVAGWFDLNGRLHITGDASATAMPVTTNTPVTVAATVTLTVGATYAAADFVGTSGTPISFASAVRVSGGTGTLRSLTISDPAASAAAALELWLFSATVTPPADSAPWSISDADALLCVGVVSIPTTAQYLSALNGILSVNNIGLKFKCAATTLFGCLVTRGAPTYTGTLQVMLGIEQD